VQNLCQVGAGPESCHLALLFLDLFALIFFGNDAVSGRPIVYFAHWGMSAAEQVD